MNGLNDLMNKAMENGFIATDELNKHVNEDSSEYQKILDKLKQQNIDIITHEKVDPEEVEEDIKKLIHADDILTSYIRDIKGFPLLSATEEIELATDIKNANQSKKILKETNITLDEIKNHQNIIDKGEISKEYFINCNLRLVVWWSSKYRNRGLSQEDIIQEGNMGLIKAVDKFDPDKGVRFSTYASNWIKKYIMRSIQNQARTIRLPIHISSYVSKLKKTARELEAKKGRDPTVEEIATAMEISPAKVSEYQSYISDAVSLDTPVGNEDALSLGDIISNQDEENPFEKIAKHEYREELNRVLSELNPREYQVITLRFGISDGNARTLEEIGRIIGLTRERVRQIEAKALRKLRHPSRCAKMKQFYQV